MTTFAEKINVSEIDSARRSGKEQAKNDRQTDSVNAAADYPIQRKAACACGGGCSSCQAKDVSLPVSQPNDASEIEADRAADQVMSLANAGETTAKSESKSLSGSLTPIAQTKRDNGSTVGTALSGKILASQKGGSVLDKGTRDFMESGFGADFGDVRVHTDSESGKMSRELNARAFTVGKNIYFNHGEYQPGSNKGRRLLAHELAHTIQQKGTSSLQPMLIQRDLAVEPTTPAAAVQELSAAALAAAVRWNQSAFADADEIALLRDVLGISSEPSVIDEEFVRALVMYQAGYGLTQDGLLGAGTAQRLADELRAEGDFLGADADVGSATEIAINPAERRMRLRSRVVGRLGRMLHQGFIGPRGDPTGVVSVRSGFSHSTTGARTNLIGINYTGADTANSRWLQFAFRQMSAIDPATRRRTYRTGTVTTSGGTARPFSDGTTFRWTVDTVPATGSMYYEAGGANERVGAHTEIFDQPAGWNGQADTFAGTFGTRPNRVRMINGFDTFLIVNNNSVVYHVRWNVYFNFNTSVTPTADVTGTYEVLSAGAISRLPAALKTALDAQFPTNTVP